MVDNVSDFILLAIGGFAGVLSGYSMYRRAMVELIRTRLLFLAIAAAFLWVGIIYLGALLGLVQMVDYPVLIRPVAWIILSTPYITYVFRIDITWMHN